MADRTGRHLIITGGTGYIGQRVVALALRQGRSVTLLGRRPGPAATRHIAWTLGEPLPADALDPALPPGEQALVHLAHDWQGDADRNVVATRTLFDSARDAGLGARVFISSQSAREQALNRYGRLKWAVEQQVTDAVSLRVGLVYGGPIQAMYGLLCRITRLPILPMVDPHRCVQPIHLDEVAQGIFGAIDRSLTGVFALTGPEPLPFGHFLKALARAYGGRRLPIVPVPLKLALFGCDMTARLPLIPTVDRERVLGLAGTEPIAAAADLARLGVVVQPLGAGLAAEPAGRRALLAEGRAFLVSAAGIAPEPALLKRYVRAFAEGAIARPRLLLRWREPLSGGSDFALRLRAAARIAEASPRTDAALSAGSRTGRMARLAGTMMLDAFRMPSRLVFGFRG